MFSDRCGLSLVVGLSIRLCMLLVLVRDLCWGLRLVFSRWWISCFFLL